MHATGAHLRTKLDIHAQDLTEAAGARPDDIERVASVLRLMLSSGGDERIWLDPITARNKYGTPVGPTDDEIWFSSSTASPITSGAYAAAHLVLGEVLAGEATPAEWFANLRRRICRLYGTSDSEAVLAASGTDAELLALCFAQQRLQRAIVSIVISPDETGSGVPRAAAGQHFLSTTALGGSVCAGTPLRGWTTIETAVIHLRDPSGDPRHIDDIDESVRQLVDESLASGKDVLLHILDTSKTGLSGPSRTLARQLSARAEERVMILVDACQLRCAAHQIQTDLNDGFMVMVSGSKFAGGPPFSGALLVPRTILREFDAARLPGGLREYSAMLDWPESLHAGQVGRLAQWMNLGLGLRWEAALLELEAFERIEGGMREQIESRFVRAVRAKALESRNLAVLDGDDWHADRCCSIIPILTDGASSLRAARDLHLALGQLSGDVGPVCHVGQAVLAGRRAVLRIALSAPMIVDVARRIDEGRELEEAFSPIQRDLDRLADKWDRLADMSDNDGSSDYFHS